MIDLTHIIDFATQLPHPSDIGLVKPSGGFAIVPRLIRSDPTQKNSVDENTPSMGLSRKNLTLVRDAMSEVVNGVSGTARNYRLSAAMGTRMAGKTGTVQVRRITKAEREAGGKLAEDTPWVQRDHSLFVGFAPVQEPRYASALIVEHGGSGTFAASLTRDIMTEVLRIDPARRPAIGHLANSISSHPLRRSTNV